MTGASIPTDSETQARYVISPRGYVDSALKRALLARSPFALHVRRIITRERHLDSGVVSVVIPFYNVERYIRAALDSVRYQRYPDLQVILVDDGSTDASPSIAKRMTELDSRFTLIRTPNVGPGAARNAGLRLATGDFICFVDGDDILPTGAIHRLVLSLVETTASFAVGGFEHLRGDERWRSPWVSRVHGETKLEVTLDDVPGITRNVFPWNKLFRKGFFDSEVGTFPEGVLYEDQVPTALAFTAPGTFNVLEETVYHWRQRPTGDSITQNRREVSHLQNRVNVMHEVDDLYRNRAGEVAYREWLVKTLFEDMMPFIEVAAGASADFQELLRTTCAELGARITADEWENTDPERRSKVLAALENRFNNA